MVRNPANVDLAEIWEFIRADNLDAADRMIAAFVPPLSAGLTRACSTRTLKTVEVLLPENQEAQLNELALRTGRGTDDLIQEAVARLLAHNAWFKEQAQIGIDQIARGEFIEEDEMDARVKRMLES